MKTNTLINIILFTLLLILSFTNSYLFINKTWTPLSYFILITICLIILLVIKLNVKLLIYISISLLPCLNYFIPLNIFSLTLPEFFIAVTVFIFMLKGNIKINKITLIYFILLFLCMLSLIGSPVSFFILGTFIRFIIVVLFSIILYTLNKNSHIYKYILLGIFSIPFVAISAYTGEGFFLHLININFLSFQRVIYSFQYPIWLSLILPLLFFCKVNRKIIFIYFVFTIYIFILSYARSIYIGFILSAIFFILFHKSKNNLIIKKSIIFFTLIAFISIYFIVSLYISRISFTSDENGSNVTRFEKFNTSYSYILKHPILGNGFGINYALDISNQRLSNDLMNDLISPEFGPLTLLAEIGIAGSILFYIILYYFFKYSIKILRNKYIAEFNKILVYIFLIAVISIFLNSNSYTNMVLLIFLAFPYLIYKNNELIKQ
jgi:hypothetical protein